MGKIIRFRRKAKPSDDRARPLFPPFRLPVSGTDARPAKFPTDAAPAAEPLAREGQEIDPEFERKRKLRRSWAIAMLLMVFMGGIAAVMFGDRGYLDVQRQSAHRHVLQTDYDNHLKRVAQLKDDVDRLKRDPAAVERIAREQLGYVAPGEVTLLLPGDNPNAPSLDAKTGSGIVPKAKSPGKH